MLGYGNPAFVIAEAGVNHNGSVELARELIRQAKKCGADAIKFQTFKAESVVTKTAEKAQYQKLVTEPKESQFHMLKKLELPISAYQELVEVCNHLGIIFLSTPYDFDDVDLLDSMGAPAFKLASMHLVEPPILEYVARKQKPILLSTGMSTLPEIDAAVEIIYKNNNQDLILLQCTTNYPTPLKEANLKVVKLLRDRYKLLVGYSDHTVEFYRPV